ncbi:hypothetical protein PIB30_054739 [Stylosanthes scabra]|uniref:Legume lectin domain-containing protein n=1 Tax=Stylosanthes scabra TaxID=79078 RepID=A0ABU6TIM5_9FABA|nr:hypothetical protein [Stylosanthes scabra]
MAMPTNPLLSSITIFLVLLNLASASKDSLSFSYNGIDEDDKTDLIFQGDAQMVPVDVVQLTNDDQNSVGRVLYSTEMHLWEKSSAHKLANFETHFSISLAQGSGTPADGLAFFLAPVDTTIPPGAVGNGGLLGLFGPNNAINPTAFQVVAVEFDTYTNDQWDPGYVHIGIDVNSIQSVNTVSWDRREGEILNVVVTYTASTQTLAVVASYRDGQKYQLSSKIDLGEVLPEYVRVGFSAATGGEFQLHTLHSWSFTSALDRNITNNNHNTMVMPTIPLLSSITIFLMLLNLASASKDSLSFSFNDFQQEANSNLILQGDAQILPNVLQLTRTDDNYGNSIGRVLYLAEMHLWEKSSAHKLANFETHFSFSLGEGSGQPADGLAFFLAPVDTTIQPGSVGNGGLLGLFELANALNTSANQVVAVEFDTYTNDWDPSYIHVGIDVNSIQSVNTVNWDRRDGEILNVVVTYTASTKTLAVVANYPDGQKYQLSSQIDLGKVLPEYVRVGLSAATGQEFQAHTLHSWSFTSALVKP